MSRGPDAEFRRGPRRMAEGIVAGPCALAIIAIWALWVLLAGAPAAASPAALAAQGPAGCPVDANACLQARRIAGQLLAGDFDGLLANAATRDYVCDGSDGRIGLGGPFPLCDGGAAGEHRQGYLWGHLGSEGSIYSAVQYVTALRTWLASADLVASDQLSGGMPRLLGLACPGSGNCATAFTIVLSELQPTPRGPMRFVLLLSCAVDAAGRAQISSTAGGFEGVTPFPLTGGRSGSAEGPTFFPWTPSVLGLTPSSGAGGTLLAAHGEGFMPGDTVSIEIDGNLENGPLLRATVGQDGRFTAPITMPTGGVCPAQVTITAFPLGLPDRSPASIALAPTAVFHVTGGAAAAGALPVVGTGQATGARHPASLAVVLALAAILAGWRAIRRASDAEAL